MPPTPIPEGFGICTVRLLRTGASAPDVVTFGYDLNNSDTADVEAGKLAADWLAAFPAASTLSHYTFTGVHVLRKNLGNLEAGDHTQSTAGTVVADECSPAVAVRVTKKTAFAGRKFRGRFYLPPAYVAEANIDLNGVIDPATLTSLQTKCNSFLANLHSTVPSHKMYLLHHDASAPTEVLNLLVRTSVGTQRRRQALL